MRKPPPSAVTKWLPLLLLSHLSHGKLIQWTINEEMEPGTKIIIDLPQELGLDRRPEGYTFKVFFLGFLPIPVHNICKISYFHRYFTLYVPGATKIEFNSPYAILNSLAAK